MLNSSFCSLVRAGYRSIAGALMAVGLIAATSSVAKADVRLGVISHLGDLVVIKQWTALTDYLSRELNEKVVLVPMNNKKTMAALKNKTVDFLLTQPLLAAIAEQTFDAKVVATRNKSHDGLFGGVVIANPGAGIARLRDIKGKTVIGMGRAGAGGYLFQAHHLLKNGIDVEGGDVSYRIAKSQKDIVLAVRAGIVDVGFVRSGLLEALHRKGVIAAGDVVVVERSQVEFPQVLTTQLYPDWFFLAMDGQPEDRIAKLRAALLRIEPDSDVAKAAKIEGFVPPKPRDDLVTMLKEMGRLG